MLFSDCVADAISHDRFGVAGSDYGCKVVPSASGGWEVQLYERVKPPRPGEVRPWVPAPVQPRPSRPSSRSLDSPHPSSPSP